MKDRGIIYISTGDSRIQQMTLLSIRSLRQAGYVGEVAVLSDQATGWMTTQPDGYSIIQLAGDHGRYGSRAVKTSLSQYSPFEQTLFLDSDIAVLQPIDAIWNVLDPGDDSDASVAMALDPNRLSDYLRAVPATHACAEEVAATREVTQAGTPFFNSGVILWRRGARSDEFFRTWNREWSRFRRIDQFALSRAISSQQMRQILELDPVYNMPFDRAKAATASPVFLHFMGEVDQLSLIQADAAHHLPRSAENANCRVAVLKEYVHHQWVTRVESTVKDLESVVPAGALVTLADEAQLGITSTSRISILPFPHRDGQYWGIPSDDSAALFELQSAVTYGVGFLAVAWPAFWWLGHFVSLAHHLRSSFRCILDNDRLKVFDLRFMEAGHEL